MFHRMLKVGSLTWDPGFAYCGFFVPEQSYSLGFKLHRLVNEVEAVNALVH